MSGGEICLYDDGTLSTKSTIDLDGSGTPAASNPYVSSDTGIATVDDNGLVTAVSDGTVTITYTDDNGCQVDADVIINANPTMSGGEICLYDDGTLSTKSTIDLDGSGTPAASNPYVSSDTGIATVDDNGLVTAVSDGTVTITYTDDNGCQVDADVIINANPTMSGGEICLYDDGTLSTKSTIDLDGSGTPAASNPYVSSDTGIATVDDNGLVTAVSDGTVTITYTDDNGCQVDADVIINANPTMSGGEICLYDDGTLSTKSTIDLDGSGTPAASNPYVSSDTGIATVDDNGLVTAVSDGTVTITYTDDNGCQVDADVIINANPTMSGGEICLYDDGTLSTKSTIDLDGSGTPAASNPYVSSDTGIATVDDNGLVTAVSDGTVTITYTDDNGCQVDADVIINANPTMSGGEICLYDDGTLSTKSTIDLDGSGTPAASNPYVSSDTGIATVDDNGLVTAVSDGTVTITYTDDNGCQVDADVIINANPTMSGGEICLYDDGTLSTKSTIDLDGSGTPAASNPYVSSDTGIATVDDNGLVTAVSDGTVTITYTDDNGCQVDADVIINANPTMSGGEICLYDDGTLSTKSTIDLDGSGTPAASNPYVSSDTGIATVDDNGLVTAVSDGTVTITYTDDNGCQVDADVIINANPTCSIISQVPGGTTICLGETIDFEIPTDYVGDSDYDVEWTSSDAGIIFVIQGTNTPDNTADKVTATNITDPSFTVYLKLTYLDECESDCELSFNSEPCVDQCTWTPGFWKNHPEEICGLLGGTVTKYKGERTCSGETANIGFILCGEHYTLSASDISCLFEYSSDTRGNKTPSGCTPDVVAIAEYFAPFPNGETLLHHILAAKLNLMFNGVDFGNLTIGDMTCIDVVNGVNVPDIFNGTPDASANEICAIDFCLSGDADAATLSEYIKPLTAFNECNNTCGLPSGVVPTNNLETTNSSAMLGMDILTYPNPHDGVLNVRYKFDYDTDVSIKFYDLKGSLVMDKEIKGYHKGEDGLETFQMRQRQDQVLFMQVTSNREQTVKKIIATDRK
ncbi:Ig-like domain-containing protein [Aegicerativicinus sediminis]|uniref:Ig-like domain-containing protein n=1 Tax=Aegicerativicinus sediminis TaxID=2893202 RepID=UPI0037446182